MKNTEISMWLIGILITIICTLIGFLIKGKQQKAKTKGEKSPIVQIQVDKSED